MWFSLHHFHIPQDVLHRIRPIASRHRDQFAHGGKTINVSFEEKALSSAFFVRECLRQKGLGQLE